MTIAFLNNEGNGLTIGDIQVSFSTSWSSGFGDAKSFLKGISSPDNNYYRTSSQTEKAVDMMFNPSVEINSLTFTSEGGYRNDVKVYYEDGTSKTVSYPNPVNRGVDYTLEIGEGKKVTRLEWLPGAGGYPPYAKLFKGFDVKVTTNKYLFQDGEEIKTYINGWQIIGTAPATKEMFDTNGMEDLSIIDNEAIQTLSSDTPQLLCWTDQSVASKTANLIAVPKPQLLLPIGDIEVKELEQVIVSSSLIGTGDLKILISGDSGATWNGKAPIDIASLEDVKTNGFTTEEFNALTTQELITFIPSGKVRFAFYLEQENIEDVIQVNSLSVGERIYTMTPSIESLSVLYELLKYEQPTLFVSRDNGVTWKEVTQDALINISDLPEGTELKVKAVLSSGQELYGLSYSWI